MSVLQKYTKSSIIEESKARQVCGMKDQITFTDVEYGNRKKTTKREEFLNKMEEIIPWKAWVEMIRPYYPKGEHGRPVRGIETMLRMYLMQTWFNLSDEGTEDAIYDSYAMRSFLGINFMTEQVPDATTLLKFRHLLEKHNIGEKIFTDIRDRLEESGLLMHGGTIVDATIISAPSSTKNRTGTRDPEMHQTKKGNQWYHGMKVHAGVDAGTRKVAYRGIAKNMNRFHVLFGCANLLMCIRAGRTEQFRNKQATLAAGQLCPFEGNSPSSGMKNRLRRCLSGCFSTFACDP